MSDDKTAYEHINQACEELNLSNQCRFKARLLSESALASPQVNLTRRVIAAASVYAASLLVNEKQTQQQVEAVTGVSKASIRTTYRQILTDRGYTKPERTESARRARSRFHVIKDRIARVLRT